MKVSIIVPVYNTEEFLEECLQNLVNQTLQDIEVIISVDETSTDLSLDICRKYETEYPEKIKVLVHPKGVPADSRNCGLEVATGEYIGFVDSDDTVLNIMYEILYKKAVETDADVVCCEAQNLYSDGTTKIRKVNSLGGLPAVDNPAIFGQATCYVWNKIFRKSLIDKYHFRFPTGRWYEDSALVYNMVLAANKVECVHIPLYTYRDARDGGTAYLIDNRVFDVILSAQDIVDFFKEHHGFEGNMIETVYKLCRDHINVRLNFFKDSEDNELKTRFIQEAFDFFDMNFPNWISYHQPENPEKNALAYAKINREFALEYFCNNNFREYYEKLNKQNKVPRDEAYIKYHQDTPIDETAILYEAYEAAGMNCNPYALFLVAINDSKLQNYRHIWAISDWKVIMKLKNDWADHPNVFFVLRNSDDYYRALSGCKYLINNNTFPPYFSKKEGQIYVTSWHAITVKTLGYDYPTGKLDAWNQVRNYMQTDWFIAANDFMKDNLATAYKMQNIFHGKIIVEGYPRNDIFQRVDSDDIKKCLQMLIENGVQIENDKKIVLYAPTWKGEKPSAPEMDLDTLNHELMELKKRVDLDQYQILVKPHHVVYRKLSNHEKASGKYIPPHLETNEILSAVDILISDYSSIFVDFMCTRRPVLFYIPDIDTYSDYRGIYFDLDELPGPITNNLEELAGFINHIEDVQQEYSSKYDAFYNRMFGGIDIGSSSERIIDCIFHGNEQKYRVETLDHPKKKILLYPGNLLKKEMRMRVSQLLAAIDYSVFDITMLVDFHSRPEVSKFIMDLQYQVRFLSTGIAVPKSKAESWALASLEKGQYLSEETKNTLEAMFHREYRRRFGDVQFDATIDLNPENVFQYHLVDQAKSAVHIIWPDDARKSKKIFVQMNYRFAGDSQCMRQFIIGPGVCNRGEYPYDVLEVKLDDFIQSDIIRKDNEAQSVSSEGDSHVVTSLNLYFPDTGLTRIVPVYNGECYKFISFSPLVKGGFNESILYAFQLVAQQFENLMLYIVAEGTNTKAIYDLIEQLEIGEQVVLVNTSDTTVMNYLLELCDCVIEVPIYQRQFSIKPIRLAQALGKKVIMRKEEEPESPIQTVSGIWKAETGIAGVYHAMKAVLQGQDDSVPAFNEKEFNQMINQALFDMISNPIPAIIPKNKKSKKEVIKDFLSAFKKKLKKTKFGKFLLKIDYYWRQL